MGYDLATRAQVLALKAFGVPNLDIEGHTGVPSQAVRRVFDRALARGFNPTLQPCRILNSHLVERPRLRRSHFTTGNPSAASTDSGHRVLCSTNGEEELVCLASSENAGSSTSPDVGSIDTSLRSSITSPIPVSETPPPVSPTARPPATRFLQAQAAMAPLFQSLSESPKFIIALLTGDKLLLDDAASFLRDDLPLWEGIWNQKETPKPAANEPSLEQVAKISRCVTLSENRTSSDHLRLRFHKLLQYQALARCLARVEGTHQTSTIDHIMEKIHGKSWSSASADQRKRLKGTFHAQKRAGKRLQIFCNHVGYGFLLLGSRAAVGKMLEPTFTDEMFHALICYVCNMFPQLRMACDRMDRVVRDLVRGSAPIGMSPQVLTAADEVEACLEERNHGSPPENFIMIGLSSEVNDLGLE